MVIIVTQLNVSCDFELFHLVIHLYEGLLSVCGTFMGVFTIHRFLVCSVWVCVCESMCVRL